MYCSRERGSCLFFSFLTEFLGRRELRKGKSKKKRESGGRVYQVRNLEGKSMGNSMGNFRVPGGGFGSSSPRGVGKLKEETVARLN